MHDQLRESLVKSLPEISLETTNMITDHRLDDDVSFIDEPSHDLAALRLLADVESDILLTPQLWTLLLFLQQDKHRKAKEFVNSTPAAFAQAARPWPFEAVTPMAMATVPATVDAVRISNLVMLGTADALRKYEQEVKRIVQGKIAEGQREAAALRASVAKLKQHVHELQSATDSLQQQRQQEAEQRQREEEERYAETEWRKVAEKRQAEMKSTIDGLQQRLLDLQQACGFNCEEQWVEQRAVGAEKQPAPNKQHGPVKGQLEVVVIEDSDSDSDSDSEAEGEEAPRLRPRGSPQSPKAARKVIDAPDCVLDYGPADVLCCGQTYATEQLLVQHIISAEHKPSDFHCSVCKRSVIINNVWNYRRHANGIEHALNRSQT